MEIDLDAIVPVFVAESEEALGEMEALLLELEHGLDPEGVNTLFRHAHTLKGNAASLGLSELSSLSHVVEELLARLRDGSVPWAGSVVTLVLRAVDALRDFLARATRPELDRGLPAGASPLPPPDVDASRAVRIDVAKLDRMLDLSGEITVARQRTAELLDASGSAAVLDAHAAADALFASLQDEIRTARMVPLRATLRGLPRVVRDVSDAQRKEAALAIEGGDVELDLRIAEQIQGPLLHVVRNAVDHGIEPPEVRKALGKPPAGQIRVRAFVDAGSVVVEVSDDGAGMQRARILARAVERGLVAPHERLPDDQILDLVFRPGFSTASEVSDLSGRGVGMDVVRHNLEALRGTAHVASVEGRGTTLTLRVPLTLTLIDGFSVRAGGETFLIPMDSIVECAPLPAGCTRGSEPTGVLPVRGGLLPFVRLRALFALPGAPAREDVVVVRHGGDVLAFVVDALEGAQRSVVKPLGPLCRGATGVSGAALLGDGGVALILDIASLLRLALARASASPSPS